MKTLFTTERLQVREWQQSDAKDLYELCKDKRTLEFMPFPQYKSIKDAYDRIAFMTERYKAPMAISADGREKTDYAIVLKDCGKAVGQIGFARKTDQAGGVVEIGCIVNFDFWRKGIAPEATKGFFKYVKANGIAMRIEAKHNTLNHASGKVLQKSGMVYEGIQRKSCDDGKMKRADMAWYSILAEEID